MVWLLGGRCWWGLSRPQPLLLTKLFWFCSFYVGCLSYNFVWRVLSHVKKSLNSMVLEASHLSGVGKRRQINSLSSDYVNTKTGWSFEWNGNDLNKIMDLKNNLIKMYHSRWQNVHWMCIADLDCWGFLLPGATRRPNTVEQGAAPKPTWTELVSNSGPPDPHWTRALSHPLHSLLEGGTIWGYTLFQSDWHYWCV